VDQGTGLAASTGIPQIHFRACEHTAISAGPRRSDPSHLEDSAVPDFSQQRDGPEPREALVNAFPFALTESISGVPRRTSINSAPTGRSRFGATCGVTFKFLDSAMKSSVSYALHAATSTKNREQQRDPEMHQTKKGKQWYFGMKAHVGVDSKTKIIHTAVATAANVADSTRNAQPFTTISGPDGSALVYGI
jgi:Transposase DDE domain